MVVTTSKLPDDRAQDVLEPDALATRELVQSVADHAVGIVNQLGKRSIVPQDAAALDATVQDMLQPPDTEPRDLSALLTQLDRAATYAADVGAPGFLGYTPSGGIVAAALGEMYAHMVNRYVGLSEAAPALAAMEHGVVRWLAEVAGLPPGSGGLLLSGGSMANFTAVSTAARDAEGAGQPGTVYLSNQAHSSLRKAAHLAGVPSDRVRVIPVDGDLRMDLTALREAIRADRRAGLKPSMIIGTAGTTATGTVDPLHMLAELARHEFAWFHVDAAYGGLFRLTERGLAVTAGMELADSVTLDPHKSLFLPCGTGALVVRDVDRLRAAQAEACEALHDVPKHGDLPDFADLGMELTREARGPRLWLPLHLYGTGVFRAALDEKLRLASTAYDRLAACPVLEAPWRPDLAVVAFRLPANGDAAAANAANESLMTAVNASGRVMVSSVMIDGLLTLRMSVLSHRTHLEHIEEALDIIEGQARKLATKRRRR